MSLPDRVLIVNPFGIGDVLFSTPLIRAVRRAFPRAYLAYLCNRRTEEILCRNKNLDELFVYEKDELIALWNDRKPSAIKAAFALLWKIQRRRFDLAIDLSLGERYSFILTVLGVPRRIGFDFRHRGRFLTYRLAIDGFQNQHVVAYYRQLLEMIGINLLDAQLELEVTDENRLAAVRRLSQLQVRDGQRIIGLAPAGGISWGLHAYFRRWPKENFIEVGRTLSERYHATLLVFGEPRDRVVCAEIAHAIGPAAMDLSGQTTLGEFISLVAVCDLIIANDGGPLHIAVSQGVPTVSIFGPVDPVVYGPYPPTSPHWVVCKPQLPCRPCYHQFKLPPCPYERACLTHIEPADVLEACEAALAKEEPVGVAA